MDLCNPSFVKKIMQAHGITLKKEFGQNFLINPLIPERIAEECAEDTGSFVLEIGPGVGCLTQHLASRFDEVAAVEIDRGLIPVLAETLADYPNTSVTEADIMKLDMESFIAEKANGRPVVVCANLPYYITTPILMRLIESGIKFTSITVMVQAEVASRLAASPGTSDYGAITAVLGYYAEVRKLFTVSAGNFLPPPKVNSAVIRLDMYDTPPLEPRDRKLFFRVIKAAFAMRRKTLVNALMPVCSPLQKSDITDVLESCGFSSTIRGERLSTADFVFLSDALFLKMHPAVN